MAEIDLSMMMQQAQALQEKLKQAQEEASQRTIEANSGGGLVRVVVDGAGSVRRIDIEQSLLASNDKSMIEDLIVVAVNDGLRRIQEMVADEMRKLAPMSGIDISKLFGGSR